MPRTNAETMGDIVTYMVAVALAAGSIGFAGYKVFKLRGMENPPADLGLSFPPPKRKIITDHGVDIDKLTTNSTDPAGGGVAPEEGQIRQPYSADFTPVESYKLLTVVDGVAFVELTTFRGTEIVPVTKGAKLRGAGIVDAIAKDGGRWTLAAGDVRLVTGNPPQ
jgi:hypothetical protein